MKIKRVVSIALAAVTAASLALSGCSRINDEAVVATLDGQEISLGLANFMAQYTAASFSTYMSYFGEDMWSQDLYGDGGTMQESVKSDVLDQIEIAYLLENHMEEYGVEITQEELDEIDSVAENFLEENTNKALKVMGASKEYVAEMLRIQLIQQKMHEAIIATADTAVSDEEAAQKTISYIKVSTQGHYDADNNYIEYTDEEKETIADTANTVAEEALTDFDAAATNHGYQVNTYSYGADEIDADGNPTGALDSAVIREANGLKEGEISGAVLVEGDGYFILRMDSEYDEDATETKKQEIISQRQSDKYTEVTESYKEAADWVVDEEVWATVNFDKLYTLVDDENTEALDSTEQ